MTWTYDPWNTMGVIIIPFHLYHGTLFLLWLHKIHCNMVTMFVKQNLKQYTSIVTVRCVYVGLRKPNERKERQPLSVSIDCCDRWGLFFN